MALPLVAQAAAKRPAPVVGTGGLDEESEQLAQWRGTARRVGEPHAELPDSLKRAKVDREFTLEAEVVRRGRPQEVPVTIRVAAALDPVDRGRWLSRALESMSREAARPSDIYDVVSHTRFAAGVTPALARSMLEDVRKQASAFPEKLRQSLLAGDFPLADVARAATRAKAAEPRPNRTAEEIMSRCVDFVRRNEDVIMKVHELEARTFQVELRRSSLQQVWGLTWARAAFNAQRRVLEAVVPDSPAGLANRLRTEAGERPFQPGDELVALDGVRGWEAMGRIRELLHAKLTFVRPVEQKDGAGTGPAVDHATLPKEKEAYLPPLFAEGGYTLDAGDGWKGHVGGQWLYSDAEEVYFHTPTGGLFIEDASSKGSFISVSVQAGLQGKEDAQQAAVEALPREAPVQAKQPQLKRQRGRVRWFSKAKGFGFILPWSEDGEAPAGGGAKGSRAVPEDIFVHRKQLLQEAEGAVSDGAQLLPGMPVNYDVGLQDDGRPCAMSVSPEANLAALCSAGYSLGSAARCIEQAALELKGHSGQPTVAAFAGLTTGRRGMGGAEYVALHLPRDLASCFQGREQGGEKGARAALLAAFRQSQHGFLQYAQRLSQNSATRWLSAETCACTALVFGPDADGRPRLLVTFAGGGHALVGRRDGTVVAFLGEGHEEGTAKVVKKKNSEDTLKVFDRGLKGPAISFPPLFGSSAQPSPEGFGAHNWSEKDGGAAGLTLDIHSHALDWEEDALLVLGSAAAWEGLPEDEEVVALALQGLREPGPGRPADRAAQRIMEAMRPMRAAKRETPQDVAVAVLRLSWCTVEGEEPDSAEERCTGASSVVPSVAHAVSADARAPDLATPTPALINESDDMFAAASSAEITRREEEDALVAEGEEEEEPPEEAASGAALPHGQTAPLATQTTPPRVAAGAVEEMDDMFADFCREIEGLQPGS